MTFSCEKHEDHLLVRCNVENIGQEEMRELENIVEDYPDENVILHFLQVRSIKLASKLKRLYNHRIKGDHSFILVVNLDLAEDLRDEYTVAQSMQEAWDLLENEEIERHL